MKHNGVKLAKKCIVTTIATVVGVFGGFKLYSTMKNNKKEIEDTVDDNETKTPQEEAIKEEV